MRKQHRARLVEANERNRIPELGPGLTPEMDGVSKPTELDATKGKGGVNTEKEKAPNLKTEGVPEARDASRGEMQG